MNFFQKVLSEILSISHTPEESKYILQGIIKSAGSISKNNSNIAITINAKDINIVKKINNLCKHAYNEGVNYSFVTGEQKNTEYKVELSKYLIAKIASENNSECNSVSEIFFALFGPIRIENYDIEILKNILIGIYIMDGYVYTEKESGKKSNGYLLEISCIYLHFAEQIVKLLRRLSIEAKIFERADRYVVYTKNSNSISDILAILGASKSVLELNDILASRDMKNTINRLNNCEIANYTKTLETAYRQQSKINYLKANNEFDKLKEPLKQVAEIRINNLEYSLQEIADILNVSKSCIKHRLSKIEILADDLFAKIGGHVEDK